MGRTYLGGVDQFVGETFCDGLNVSEGGFSSAGAKQPDRLVDAAQRRHIDRLSANGARPPDARRVLARTRIDDRVHQHLHWVLKAQTARDVTQPLVANSHRHTRQR